MLPKIGLLALSVVLAFGCSQDDVDSPSSSGPSGGGNTTDVLPTVVTQSVELQNGTTFLCTGQVTSFGNAGPVEYGFCASTDPDPQLDEHHADGSLQGDHFTVSYNSLNTGSTYYFRAWATNDSGAVLGNVISYTPPVQDTPPCTPAVNSYIIGGVFPGNGTFGIVTGPQLHADGTWQVVCNASYADMYLVFNSEPVPGTYVTTNSPFPDPGQANVHFVAGSGINTSGTVNAGNTVYVTAVGTSQLDFTVCSAPWASGPGQAVTTRIRSNP
jgi:hypothetical protein